MPEYFEEAGAPTLEEIAVMEKELERGCACYDDDAYGCWRRRYDLDWSVDVVEDGGPCMCYCHDEHEDD